MNFENVKDRSLREIWETSAAFQKFRGEEWMQEPCRSCDRRELDFGGCRCQALLLVNDAAAADPVCSLSPNRNRVDVLLGQVADIPVAAMATDAKPEWVYRQNPT